MNDFISDLLELMPDTIGIQPAVLDNTGDLVPSGALINPSPQCRIEGGPVRVTDPGGRETVSRYQIYIGDPTIYNERDYLWNLPVRFPEPKTNIRAIRVDVETDEEDASYTVVYLP